MAWLSDSGNTPKTRLHYTSVTSYINTVGKVVAINFADLCDGSLNNLIKTETGGAPPSTPNTWTGTLSDCSAATDTCSDWTNNTEFAIGLTGNAENLTLTWTEVSSPPCHLLFHLYCVGQ